MKKFRQILANTFPNTYESLRYRIGHPARYMKVSNLVTQKYGKTIIDGPFKGMTYISTSAGSAYIPKILGCYELELHTIIEKIIEHQYSYIIDVGCAEGYYAVGLAIRCPNSQIYAFDVDQNAQELCAKLAQINGVSDHVHIGGLCDAERLEQLCLENTLLICDIESHEIELINPTLSPSLNNVDILVEFHEPLRAGVTKVILERLSKTHSVILIDAVERNPDQHPSVEFLPKNMRDIALTESRPPGQQFAFFQSLQSK